MLTQDEFRKAVETLKREEKRFLAYPVPDDLPKGCLHKWTGQRLTSGEILYVCVKCWAEIRQPEYSQISPAKRS